MIDNPLVSIIVPVYNVKPYLQQCLDSLVAINYQPKEIVVVDDCSTDGSLDICRTYENSHPGLTLIEHSLNMGVQAARITGVNNACGDYVMFVDSDDYVDPEILNHLVISAVQFNADLVCAQIFRSINGTKQLDKRSVFGVFNKKDIKDLFYKIIMDESLYKAGMPLYFSGKLFKKENLLLSLNKGIKLRYGEDELAVIDYLMNYTETLVCIESPLYYYRYHPAQVSAKTVTDLWPDLILLWEHLDELTVWSWETILSRRMWCFIKPSIYLKPFEEKPSKFIFAMKQLRTATIVKKHIFDNSELSPKVKKHPHYLLLKYRLYLLDYLMYFLIWLLPKR